MEEVSGGRDHARAAKVLDLDGAERTATIKPMFVDEKEVIDFDFCVIAAGCNFGVFHKMGGPGS